MRLGRILAHRWHSLFRRSRAELELQREIALHIEQLAKEYRDAGISQSEALNAARRWRIVRQLLMESVLMAGLGGLLGLFVA